MSSICSIFFFAITFIYYLHISSADDDIVGLLVDVKSKPEEEIRTNIRAQDAIDLNYILKNGTYSLEITSYAFPLLDSNCFCLYDPLINLLLCSPLLQNSSSYPYSWTNLPLINITLNDCTFSHNHLTLPIIKNKTIDHLRLYDVNHQDYLVLDPTSFSFYPINHLYIIYSYSQPITMLLISNGTFSSSLRTLYIDCCYIITLNQPLNRLFLLESITLMNIQQFSWKDFQQQIISLPKLSHIYIAEEILASTNDIFNVLSCRDLSSQWILTYRLIQTCSCQFLSFLKSIRHFENLYRCPHSNNSIDFIDNICQFNAKEYQISNNTNLFCNQCLSDHCPNGTFCAETLNSTANCLSPFRHDYDIIRTRIPLTSYTKPFLWQESHDYLTTNPNQTLEVSSFNSLAMILIDSNQNRTDNSSNDVQMFYQTFADMLSRPWSPQIYAPASSTAAVCQSLLLSLDESIKSITDSEEKFEFQSKPISTISIHLPTDQQPPDTFSWQITNDNIIIANITNNSKLSNQNLTSRVFLQFNHNSSSISNCVTSNTKTNCTNRLSITSIKSPKLFYNTNQTPEYDVISLLAPTPNQRVTFYFDHEYSSTDPLIYSTNTTNSTSDPFYDQLDLMISEGNCMYLNTTSMLWQMDGCTTDRQLSDSTSVVCIYEHLTMFTVFFSPTCATPSKTLVILSWIGCGLSIIGLSITLIIFVVISQCRETRNSSPGISSSYSSSSQELRRRIMSKPRPLSMVKSMLFLLCILLIIMNILIFILTFIKSGRNLACTIFSALLYYFTLTAFLWKFLFAVQQSLFITNLFQPYWSNRTLFLIYFFIAFSLPICPLLIMFLKYPNSTFISSTCNYCWLTREFLIYGLIIPIIVIIGLNVIFYFYTMIHLCRRNRQQPGLRSTKSDQSRHTQNFKIGLFFAIIMGFSWIFGFLLLIPNSYVQLFGNILFCIVNSLQGFTFSIMVFCMIERKSFRKYCCCCCLGNDPMSRKTTLNSQSMIPQQLPIVLNRENDGKIKTSYISSIYTSTTSNGENNNHEGLEQYRNKTLPIRKEDDEEEEEHVYSSLAL